MRSDCETWRWWTVRVMVAGCEDVNCFWMDVRRLDMWRGFRGGREVKLMGRLTTEGKIVPSCFECRVCNFQLQDQIW